MTLTPDAEVAAFRIVQEALTNVLKHAAADAARRTPGCQVMSTSAVRTWSIGVVSSASASSGTRQALS